MEGLRIDMSKHEDSDFFKASLESLLHGSIFYKVAKDEDGRAVGVEVVCLHEGLEPAWEGIDDWLRYQGRRSSRRV
jgi:hypothetical protein